MDAAIAPIPAWIHHDQEYVAGSSPLQFTGLTGDLQYNLHFNLVTMDGNPLLVRFNADAGANYLYAFHEHGESTGALHTQYRAVGQNEIIMCRAACTHAGEIKFHAWAAEPTQVWVWAIGFSYCSDNEYLGWSGGGLYEGSPLVSIELIQAGAGLAGWATLKKMLIPNV